MNIMENEIDLTFRKLKQIDFEIMLKVLANNLLLYFDYSSGSIGPFSEIADRFSQTCLENGWTTESFLENSFKGK